MKPQFLTLSINNLTHFLKQQNVVLSASYWFKKKVNIAGKIYVTSDSVTLAIFKTERSARDRTKFIFTSTFQ